MWLCVPLGGVVVAVNSRNPHPHTHTHTHTHSNRIRKIYITCDDKAELSERVYGECFPRRQTYLREGCRPLGVWGGSRGGWVQGHPRLIFEKCPFYLGFLYKFI